MILYEFQIIYFFKRRLHKVVFTLRGTFLRKTIKAKYLRFNVKKIFENLEGSELNSSGLFYS